MNAKSNLSHDIRSKWGLWIFALASLAAVALTYSTYATGLFAAWQREEYSHGIIIPFLALLIGLNIFSEKKPIVQVSWLGIPVIFLGYCLIAISELSAFEPPAHYGLVVILSGVSLTFLGKRATTFLTPALIYLFFAIPLPKLFEVALTAELQLLSSSLGVFILQSLSVPVFQDGNVIDLGAEKIQVVEACSGLRYLFPLMSFSYLLAFLFQGQLWKRAVVFLSAIPLTLIMNSLRIALVGVLVNQWGSQMADGLIHDFEGWVIFVICIIALLIEIWLLSRIGHEKNYLKFDYIGLPKGINLDTAPPVQKTAIAALALCALMTILFFVADLRDRPEIIPERESFYTFPLTIENWKGHQEALDPAIIQALGFSDYWNANYQRNEHEPPVSLYMAYYQSQRLGNAAHSPSNCIPGGGWEVKEKNIVAVEMGNFSLPVTRMVIKKGTEAMLVYYWFDQRGRILNEQFGIKWYLFVDSITRQRTDGAVIRVMTQMDNNSETQIADERVKSFLKGAYNDISPHVPK